MEQQLFEMFPLLTNLETVVNFIYALLPLIALLLFKCFPKLCAGLSICRTCAVCADNLTLLYTCACHCS